jgi:trehalose-6-phosphate synthase
VNQIKELMKSFEGKRVIIGVDRLDYIKGIPHKLRALKQLFQQHPEWREKVVLVQIAVPTRLDVPEYQELKCEVEELVGSINGQFSTISSSPIHYLFTSVNFAGSHQFACISTSENYTGLKRVGFQSCAPCTALQMRS